MKNHEKERLEVIAKTSLYAHEINGAMIQACFRIFRRYLHDGPTLELGPAEGLMTDLLLDICDDLTVVEGAKEFCDAIEARHPGVRVINALFEEFTPERKFSNIILGHVLEHVEDPVKVLKKAAKWLAPGGRILAAVPNSRSIHRQAAVIMGLLPYEEALNNADRHHGHRRVYNPETLRRDFHLAGLSIEVFGGYWLKPVSNSQIESNWTPEMLDAFMALGERYPDIAAEIYVIAHSGPKKPCFSLHWKLGDKKWTPGCVRTS
ncbi:class I SAM-dependent methyltransferase [Tepidimonas taiwanensis]|uniref:class I SAM-dependent methyltransferase n=1 Tax=Tepidimonas taiwanensis TaxID=307486 RepID=UPI0009E6ACDB|nr:class I SAM-dependent methyltransferase [Tepidimonas taiwanensis]